MCSKKICFPVVNVVYDILINIRSMSEIEVVSSNRCFGGDQLVVSHLSNILSCKMKFSIYLPPKSKDVKCPVVYFLSGLTCDEQVFINKSGAQMAAAQHGIILVGPDTSPRGKLLNIHILSPLFAILSFAIFY